MKYNNIIEIHIFEGIYYRNNKIIKQTLVYSQLVNKRAFLLITIR